MTHKPASPNAWAQTRIWRAQSRTPMAQFAVWLKLQIRPLLARSPSKRTPHWLRRLNFHSRNLKIRLMWTHSVIIWRRRSTHCVLLSREISRSTSCRWSITSELSRECWRLMLGSSWRVKRLLVTILIWLSLISAWLRSAKTETRSRSSSNRRRKDPATFSTRQWSASLTQMTSRAAT